MKKLLLSITLLLSLPQLWAQVADSGTTVDKSIFSKSAQPSSRFSVGISLGWDYNTPTIDKGYASDYTYKGRGGWDLGAIARYQFKDWVAVRADLRLSTRCYKMERHYETMNIDQIYTNHRDLYMHVPVMADFSVGSRKVRGHFYTGFYMGSWLSAHRSGVTDEDVLTKTTYRFSENMEFDSRRDNRFNAGLMGGIGLSYFITPKWEAMVESFYMYDLTKSNKTNPTVTLPRYNSTMMVNVGVMYNF